MERDLYTFTDADGNKRDDVENAFAYTEADAGELTRRLTGGGDISMEEKYRYAAFVANMIIRTKSFHARLTQTLRRDFGLAEVRPEHLLLYTQMHMMKLGQIIFHMNWSVIRTPSAAGFLTSDNPVSVALLPMREAPDFNCSILDPRAMLTMPLAMNACLVAEWSNPSAPLLTIDGDDPLIATINLMRIASAHDNIFASEQSVLPKPSDTEGARLAHPYPSVLLDRDVELFPPHGVRIPDVFGLTRQLMFVMLDADLPTDPIQR